MTADARKRKSESLEPQVREVIAQLDDQGRWISSGMLQIGTFVARMNLLCEYLECAGA
jgi:hypothetical protein